MHARCAVAAAAATAMVSVADHPRPQSAWIALPVTSTSCSNHDASGGGQGARRAEGLLEGAQRGGDGGGDDAGFARRGDRQAGAARGGAWARVAGASGPLVRLQGDRCDHRSRRHLLAT